MEIDEKLTLTWEGEGMVDCIIGLPYIDSEKRWGGVGAGEGDSSPSYRNEYFSEWC